MSNENMQNSLEVETPEQVETTNITTPTANSAGGINVIKNGKTYSNNFSIHELITARDNILNSGLDLGKTEMINILFNRLDPQKISRFINHILYSKKILPANDCASAVAVNSVSYVDGKILNSLNGQTLSGPVGTGPFKSDDPTSISSGSKVNRTHLSFPTDNNFVNIDILHQASNTGGFKCYATENLTKRYDRLVNDQGQLTKGVEKAFDNKGFPVLEAQAALNCYGHDKVCFTKEAITEMLYLCRTNTYVTLNTANRGSITIFDKRWMNSNNVTPYVTRSEESFVSKAQTEADLVEQIGRILFTNWFDDIVFAPNVSFDNIWNANDYVVDFSDGHKNPFYATQDIVVRWLDRYKNGTNVNFVGYKAAASGVLIGKWGTIINPPTFTDVAGYTSYINDSSNFTPVTTTSYTFTFAEPTDEYNVQDIMSAYCYLANRFGRYSTPYGSLNMTGATGDNVNTQIFTSPVWCRIGYCLGFLQYDLDHTTVFDESKVLLRNKLYHFNRYYFGLMLTGLTKFFGSAENIPIMLNNPRTATVTHRLYWNLFSMLNFMYFTPDGKDLYFMYPLAKTSSANYTANMLYTLSGTYTPGNLFNNYGNTKITGPLSSSTADLSYHVYLEDYQWWRGDIFGGLNEVNVKVLRSAGSGLSLIRQSVDNDTPVELECGYYSSQGCDSCEIDLWGDAYGTTERKKVRLVNWNNTDTVVRFVQPLIFIWGGVVTALRIGGLLGTPTTNTFNPTIPMASFACWAELAPNVKSSSSYSPEMDF